MDGNKDEAIKCRELAEKYIREGNKEKALKFLAKSNKLYPSKEVEGKDKYRKISKSQRFQVRVPVLLCLLYLLRCRNWPNLFSNYCLALCLFG